MPLQKSFWPSQGASVSETDHILVKLGRIIGPCQDGKYYGASCWVSPNGGVNVELRDATKVHEAMTGVPREDLARIPGLLKALPPSDPTAGLYDREYVAFPLDGRYVVRTYRRGALPSAVDEIAEALRERIFGSDAPVPRPSR